MDSARDLAFVPCAATASGLLYTKNSQILYFQFEDKKPRVFTHHTCEVLLLSVNSNSQDNPGNRLASCDSNSRLSICNLLTGIVLCEHDLRTQVKTLAWMSDGRVVMGDAAGIVMTFDLNSKNIITLPIKPRKIAITALAPLDDCRTFAIGYQDGSLLLFTLDPESGAPTLVTFTLPSAIINVAWHAPSILQNLNCLGLLAIQTQLGALQVWNVAKCLKESAMLRCKNVDLDDAHHPASHRCMGWASNGYVFHGSPDKLHFWDVKQSKTNTTTLNLASKAKGMAIVWKDAHVFTFGIDQKVRHFQLTEEPALRISKIGTWMPLTNTR